MPDDSLLPVATLTPWRMFLNAGIPVQAVMVALLIASILTWSILLIKSLELAAGRRRLTEGMRAAHQFGDLSGLRQATTTSLALAFADAALAEMDASQGLPATGAKERIALSLQRLEAGMTRQMQFGAGILASIGSCAPFIGLLGTVWGIMNSFIGISRTHATNLAVVAPGIAEALLATTCGLLAAIPAVLAYNFLVRSISGYRAGLGDLAALVLTRASREIDRQRSVPDGPGRVQTLMRRAVAE